MHEERKPLKQSRLRGHSAAAVEFRQHFLFRCRMRRYFDIGFGPVCAALLCPQQKIQASEG